jgi:4-methyl-5(b-hydroxyethyl)-thiazole monophosphate biosynthesis
MANALVLLAPGFEEMEAVICIDVLRRASVTVTTAALSDLAVQGSRGIVLQAEQSFDAVKDGTFDVVILPGGQPGATHLRDDGRVRQLLVRQNERGGMLAAICAAPMVLDAAGLLTGRAATAFPGVQLSTATYRTESVVEDGNVVTSRGPGTAFEFALTLARRLVGDEKAAKVRSALVLA